MNKIRAPYSILKYSCQLSGDVLAFESEHNAIKYAIFALTNHVVNFKENEIFMATVLKGEENYFIISTKIPDHIKEFDCYVVESITINSLETDGIHLVNRRWVKAKESCEIHLATSRYYYVDEPDIVQKINLLSHDLPIDKETTDKVETIMFPYIKDLHLERVTAGKISSSRIFDNKLLIAVPLTNDAKNLTYIWSNHAITCN